MRLRQAAAASLLLTLVGCNGGDEAADAPTSAVASTIGATSTTTTALAPTSTADVSTTTSTTVGESGPGVEPSLRGEIEAAIEPSSIWMTVGSGVDADRVCSPAQPAVAVLTVPAILDTDGVRARVTAPSGRSRVVELDESDDGGWSAVIGPFEATRSSRDNAVLVDIEALLPGGAVVTGRAELELLAPVPCAEGEQPAARRSEAPAIELRLDPADGLFVATGVVDCASRPTEVRLQARTRGAIVAVGAILDRPDGDTFRRAFTGGPDVWRMGLGGLSGSADMPERSIVPVTVVATDATGATATALTTLTIARPVPCDATTTTIIAGSTTSTTSTTVPLRVRVTSSAPEFYATAPGACPPGATSVAITAATTGAVGSVVVETRTASGATATWTMSEATPGRWTADVGPIEGSRNMPLASDLDIRVVVTGTDGSTVAERATLELRRPPACATSTTTTTSNPTVTTTTSSTTTVVPTSTTTSSTTSSTTTTAPLSIETRPPDPTDVDATADGACPARPTTFLLEARTTGRPDNVGARITLATGQQLDLPMAHQGGGVWSVTVGPIPGKKTMPATSAIQIAVMAQDASGSVTDTTSATLHRPPACP